MAYYGLQAVGAALLVFLIQSGSSSGCGAVENTYWTLLIAHTDIDGHSYQHISTCNKQCRHRLIDGWCARFLVKTNDLDGDCTVFSSLRGRWSSGLLYALIYYQGVGLPETAGEDFPTAGGTSYVDITQNLLRLMGARQV